MTRAKMAGLIRGGNKVPQGAYATDSDANRQDGVDATHLAKMQRGYDGTYAFARDAINADTRKNGAPNVFITGDELALNAESFIALLSDLTVLVGGGGPMTNNNGVTFVTESSDDESPLYEETVGNFVSASSQYLSLPTQNTIELGTGSFIIAQSLKSSTKSSLMALNMYGDLQATKPAWLMEFGSSGNLECYITDGTNSAIITDPIANRWNDGKEHTAIMVVDRTNNIMYFLCDGVLIGSVSISSVTGTLTLASSNLYIGAVNNNGSKSRYFNGNLGPIKIAKAADYNLPKLFLMVEREASVSGSFSAPTNDSAKRLNNKFTLPATANSYTKCVKEFEDGVYDVLALFERQASGGTLQIYVDDVLVLSQDTSGSAGSNISTSATGIKIGAGKHVIKVKNTVAQTIPLQWIKFMKTSGQEFWNGGATDILLLGDQFKRANNPLTLTVNTGAYYNNDVLQTASPALNDYMEMDMYISPGLYYYSYHYPQTANKGKITLKIGDVIVFQDFQANGSTTNNSVKSGWVRLKGGKQTIQIQVTVDGASSKFEIAFSALRLSKKDLVRGRSTHMILGADQDAVVSAGTVLNNVSTTHRFNTTHSNSSSANNDQRKFNKFFSVSGTYKIRIVFVKNSDHGKFDMGLDSSTTSLFSGIDCYNASLAENNILEVIFSTTRGYHDLVLTTNGKNASASSYTMEFEAIQFELIEAYAMVGGSALEEDGKLKLLYRRIAQLNESTTETINLSDIISPNGKPTGKYSKLIIKCAGFLNASAKLQLIVNGGSANYYQQGAEYVGGVQTLINILAATNISLVSLNTASGSTKYDVTLEIDVETVLHNSFLGKLSVSTDIPADSNQTIYIPNNSLVGLTSLLFSTSTSTWLTGSSISIWGI